MRQMTWGPGWALVAALALALVAAGCGVDDEDPEAVARALAEANYRCDEDAVEQLDELTLPSKRKPIEPRADNCDAGRRGPYSGGQLEGFDRNAGQPPDQLPELALSTEMRGDFAVVHAAELNDNDEEDITLVRTDDGWRWDPEGDPS